jgi:hypothetical protein
MSPGSRPIGSPRRISTPARINSTPIEMSSRDNYVSSIPRKK